MYFSELTVEQLYEIDGGCGLCAAGGIIGGAATVGGIALALGAAAPVVIIGCIVGGFIGYLITT